MNDLAGYFRFSNKNTGTKSISYEHHYNKLLDYGVLPENIFWDFDSGGNSNRADYQKLLAAIRAGTYRRVAIAVLERLTRNILDWELILKDIDRLGCEIIFIDRAIDLNTPEGRTLSRFDALYAQLELEKNRDRRQKQWAHHRKMKYANKPPFGFIIEKKKYKTDWEPFICLLETKAEISRAEIATELIDTFWEVRSLSQTERQMNERYGIQKFNTYKRNRKQRKPKQFNLDRGGVPYRPSLRFSRSGIAMWLLHPALCGHTPYFKGSEKQEIHYDTHPEDRFLTELEQQQIKAIIDQNYKQKGFGCTKAKYPLSGLVVCAVCGGGGNKESAGKEKGRKPRDYYYYQCANANKKACLNKLYVKAESMIEIVIEALCGRAEQIAAIANAPPDRIDPPELQQLKTQLAGLKTLGSNPAIVDAIDKLTLQIQEFERNEQNNYELQTTNYELLVQTFSDPIYFKSLPMPDQRRLFHGLVEKVLIKDGAVVEVVLKV
jgi:site-specific DNA recombinase